ncbi:MAG: DMT family transporter [Proteobacteria bacterium]|nr:DMT family transporter [Pseudomonadota bacterium]
MNGITRGYLLGLVGVAIFSLTLPLTRIAVQELNPLFLSIGRTVLAAAIALPVLLLSRQPWPALADLRLLLVTAAGVVFGFPVLSAIAMHSVPASHGGVVLGALPLATAAMSTVFAGERPSRAFWFWSAAGSLAVIVFALWDGGLSLQRGDLLLLGALLAAAAGYAAGGTLSRKLGGWQVICWTLVIALPLTLPLTLILMPAQPLAMPAFAWGCFLYLAVMSQLVGFFAWNAGLATGGVAKVGQVQLLQTFLTLAAAAVINGEPLTWRTCGFAVLVAACVWFGRKAQVRRN